MEQPPKQRRCGQIKKLSQQELMVAVHVAILSGDNLNLTFLSLIDRYDFDPELMKSWLQEKGLHLSFSNLKYFDIAHFVGRNPYPLSDCGGMPLFQLHRARLPTSLFKDIIRDVQLVIKQYGPPAGYQDEEATWQILPPLINRSITQFNSFIMNSQESIIPDSVMGKGHIVTYFKAFKTFAILVIQVKRRAITLSNRLNVIAQVIAELDACDFVNENAGLGSSPIHGVVFHGSQFDFFRFDGSTKPPTFSRGVSQRGIADSQLIDSLHIDPLHTMSPSSFIASLRPICETLYFFLLTSYKDGMEAYYQSLTLGRVQSEQSGSASGWMLSHKLAQEALNLAVHAAVEAANGNIDFANERAELASTKLEESVNAVPETHNRRKWDIMTFWDDDEVDRA